MGRTIIVDGVGTDTGTLELPGSVQIGNDPTEDTVTVTALVASDIVPDAPNTRTLGSQGNYWMAVDTNAVHYTAAHAWSGTFTKTVADGLVAENIMIVEYDASLYVGGTVTVWMGVAGSPTTNYAIAEYVFVNHDDGFVQGATIDKIGGAQAVSGTTPIAPGCSAVIDVGTPNMVQLRLQNTIDAVVFPTATVFIGRCRIVLMKV